MRLAVLGDPVAHSLSPAIHSAALAAAGLPGTYEARAVDEGGLRDAFADLRSGELDGANVTMPHKRTARRLCDLVEQTADRARAVNTLVRVGDVIAGHNTDVAGIVSAWRTNGLPDDGPVLILGNGGAAAAALLALEGRTISISSRRTGEGGRLAETLGLTAEEVPWGRPVTGAVVVNATPLGMDGESLPDRVLAEARALFDMAYGATPTPAVALFAETGRPVCAGIEMLVAQARESFRLWTGIDIDVGVFREAAVRQMRRGTASST